MAEAEKSRAKHSGRSAIGSAKRVNRGAKGDDAAAEGRIETVYKPLDWFKPHPRNARTHSKKQIRKLAQLLREFGFVGHIVAKGDGTIIAGHGRHEAARFNDANGDPGFKELPTIIVDGWSDQKIRAFILADNRIAEDAGWDDELLKIELSELSASDFDVALTGFDEKEIGRLITEEIEGNLGAGGEDEGDEVVCECPGCGHKFKASFVAVEKKKSRRKRAKSSGESGDDDDGHRDPAATIN